MTVSFHKYGNYFPGTGFLLKEILIKLDIVKENIIN